MVQAIRDEEPAVTSPPSPEIYRDCVSSLYLPATALLRGDNRFGFFSVVECRQLFSIQALTRQTALLDGRVCYTRWLLYADVHRIDVIKRCPPTARSKDLHLFSLIARLSKRLITFAWNRVHGKINTTLKNDITLCIVVLLWQRQKCILLYNSLI